MQTSKVFKSVDALEPVKQTEMLIAIEGIDGSGKRTQTDLLTKALEAQGHSVFTTGFPQYDSWFGKMIGQFLNGDFGPLESVDPHFSALLYAGDRFAFKANLDAALQSGKIVLIDRYIASNLAHQTARVPPEKRAEFQAWIEHLEYNIYGLPRESLILYLKIPALVAQSQVARKSTRTYTNAKQDLQEASLKHLEQAAAIYDLLSSRPHWTTIECFDITQNAMRSPKEIAAEISKAVTSRLETPSKASVR